MNNAFSHKALSLNQDKPLVYTAMSKHLFYFRMYISQFVLEQNSVPLNPFMIFDYFMLDTVDRDIIREANNNLVKRADELWVFGQISDGVLAEIKTAQKNNKPLKFFTIEHSRNIIACKASDLGIEENIKTFAHEIV